MIDILILDHDEDVRTVMKAVLETNLFKVETLSIRHLLVEDIAKAILTFDPKVVLYDLGPPPLTQSFDRWQQVVSKLYPKDTAFILMTSNPWLFGKAPMCRIRMLLPRPVGLNELTKAIQFFIKEYPCHESNDEM